MAEAVAGETGKPYVFVDPGAFTNMFMGVGILKVKSLFRKLRKLALRYGGVIVFFDEADSLGSRGAARPGRPGLPARHDARRRSTTRSCHGYQLPVARPDAVAAGPRRHGRRAGPKPADGHVGSGFVMGGMGGGGAAWARCRPCSPSCPA